MKKYNLIKIILVLILVIAIAFSLLKIFGYSSTQEIKEFNVKAFRFGYTPNEIIVNKGDRVKIFIENIDTIHGMRIPEFDVSGNEVIEFIANKEGEFIWYCNSMCGSGHGTMNGKLIVK